MINYFNLMYANDYAIIYCVHDLFVAGSKITSFADLIYINLPKFILDNYKFPLPKNYHYQNIMNLLLLLVMHHSQYFLHTHQNYHLNLNKHLILDHFSPEVIIDFCFGNESFE